MGEVDEVDEVDKVGEMCEGGGWVKRWVNEMSAMS